MRTKIAPIAISALVGLIFLSGCSSAKEQAVSSACNDALTKQAAAVVDTSLTAEQANNAERPALSACKDAAEWMNGVKANPSSVGFTTVTQDTAESNIITACIMLDSAYSTPVCADANQRGLLD
nr:hypothetical protein pA58H3_p07 [Arthrobacter sp.]